MKLLVAGAVACTASMLLSGCGGAGNAVVENVLLASGNALAAARATDDFFDLFELTEFVDEFIEGRNLAWYGSGTERQCISGDANSGTWQLTAAGVDATPRAGDFITVTYKNCLQDPGIPDRLSGAMTIKLTAVTGNPAAFAVRTAWSYKADVTFTKMEIKNTHRHHIIDGAMAMEVGARGLASKVHHDIYDLKIAAANIHIRKDADDHAFTNVNLAIVQDATSATPLFQASVNGSIDSPILGGKLDVQTLSTLAGSGYTEYPSAGHARILGGSGSSLDFKPGAGGTIALQLSAANQAVQTINTTWSEVDHD